MDIRPLNGKKRQRCTLPLQTKTSAVALWQECLPRKREVVGSIHGRDTPKSLKLVIVDSPLALRIMGVALRLARRCQDNSLKKSRKHGFVKKY